MINSISRRKLLFWQSIGLLILVPGCPKKRKPSAQKRITRVGPVPIMPRAKNLKVHTKTASALSADFSVPVPRKRAAHFYRVKLTEERWVVTQSDDAERTVMLARRGFYRLRITLRTKGPGKTGVRLDGKRLTEAEALSGRPPPLPPDLKLPDNILWDGRILAAPGDDVEIRGRSNAGLEPTLQRFASAFRSQGWKARRGKNTLTFTKSNRNVVVRAVLLKKNLTGIHLLLNADEITRRPVRPAPDGSVPPPRARPKTGDAQKTPPRPGESVADLTLPRLARTRPATPRGIASLKLPKGWKQTDDSDHPIAAVGVRFVHPSPDLKRLSRDLRRALVRQGWKPRRVGNVPAKGLMRVLLFGKGKKYLTITLKRGISGATADFMLAK